MIQGIFSHPPPVSQQQQNQYQQSTTSSSGSSSSSSSSHTQRVQEIVNSVLAANDAAVELLRPPPQSSSGGDSQQNNYKNEEEARSILQWAIQRLAWRPAREDDDDDEHHCTPMIHNQNDDGSSNNNNKITIDGNNNHGEWAQQDNPDAATCRVSEAQANAMMIDDNDDGMEGGLRLGHSQPALSRASSSSSTTSTADQHSCGTAYAPDSTPFAPNSTSTEAQRLSPQSILTLDGTALSIYLTSTVTRHELIVHSVHADSALDNSLPNNHNGPRNHPPFLWSTVAMADEMDSHSSPGNLFSIYNRPFIVNDQWRTLDALAWSQSLPHVPAILQYNLGLLYHRLACRSGALQHFYRALECYDTAALLLQGNALAGIYYLTELDILLLALRNNMGHVHSHLHNLPEAQECLHRLLAVFYLSDCKSLMAKDEYVFFYMNILLFLNRFPLLAGAA